VQEDSYDSSRAAAQHIATKSGEIAGLPTPVDGEQLILEPSHILYEFFKELREKENFSPIFAKEQLVNRFWSRRLRSDVVIFRDENGKLHKGVVDGSKHFENDMHTMGCSIAWSMKAETKALETLGTLIKPHLLKMYRMTGMFLETSKRSGVVYIFRRLRPTVAMRANDVGTRILACLCLHPIGYYAETWAGVMCPTDDVIAHLLMMRSDEKFYWRRSNQIPPWRPEAGL
jgi:hypothetical protein